jgi:hypothetical protein
VTRVLLSTVLLAGCTVGGSSSVVGRWRDRRIVDSTACAQAPGGACEPVMEIGRDIPARKFTSLAFTFPATGYMQQRGSGTVGHGFVLSSYFEYLRGRGGLAIGGRIGADIGIGFQGRLLFTMPVSVVAHAGGLWGAIYAGAGYSPVAFEQQGGSDGTRVDVAWHHNSVHVLAGTRV